MSTKYADAEWVTSETALGRVYLHEAVWTRAHGDIPDGFGVGFKDGNPLNCQDDNLMLIDGRVMSHPSALFAVLHGLARGNK